LEAATGEFAAYGMGGARIDAVARKSGSNKRMIYHYFGDKDGLYLQVLEHAFEKMRVAEAQLDLADIAPLEGLEVLTRFVWRYFLDNPEIVSILGTENLLQARYLRCSVQAMKLNHGLVDHLSKILASGVREGCFRAEYDPVTVFITIAAMSFFYLSNQYTLSTIFGLQLLDQPNPRNWEHQIVHVVLSSISIQSAHTKSE
jgi:AcrR family transcriptional regulator